MYMYTYYIQVHCKCLKLYQNPKKDESVLRESSWFSAMKLWAPIPTVKFSSPCWFSKFVYSPSVITDTEAIDVVETNSYRNRCRSSVIQSSQDEGILSWPRKSEIYPLNRRDKGKLKCVLESFVKPQLFLKLQFKCLIWFIL